MLNDYCREKKLLCGKCTHQNFVLNTVIQLMRAEDEEGVPKLGYWNPQTQRLEISTKDIS